MRQHIRRRPAQPRRPRTAFADAKRKPPLPIGEQRRSKTRLDERHIARLRFPWRRRRLRPSSAREPHTWGPGSLRDALQLIETFLPECKVPCLHLVLREAALHEGIVIANGIELSIG